MEAKSIDLGAAVKPSPEDMTEQCPCAHKAWVCCNDCKHNYDKRGMRGGDILPEVPA
jgi:hypothetical protein